ncbi:unnamed protein product [Ceutorhynchus assimilis]|uniref:Coiled-coil domain-containing protein 93 n=1 Tax=Ceutorhynchus assimilis TaxID=467358 RepID=A0A9N9MD08_9CUCU|nr:unnamed protein product [Ceutorhynchus assimilis]
MAKVNQDLLQKFQKASLAPKRQEGDGHEIKVEVREDEEQATKLQQIIDILVAAGYFRARIKGLSPFDKVVGGMTWCVESLNVDVDVDLLFQENSTIGQKIALTEKIVAVLPKIKCPHRIEPHQIQGLDFIHIFPLIQWLVKVSMEARQEKFAFVRSYAINQYEKEFPCRSKNNETGKIIDDNLKTVEEVYRPRRYYKRKNAPPPDVLSRLRITLLEYGFRDSGKSKQSSVSSSEEQRSQKAQPANIRDDKQKYVDQHLTNLTATKEDILQDETLTEEEKETLIDHYKTLHSELKDGGIRSKEIQEQTLLEKQKILSDNIISRLSEVKLNMNEEIEKGNRLLSETRMKQNEANRALKEFAEEERNNPSDIKEIEELVLLNDNLKRKEASFRESCRKEMAKLQKEIGEMKELQSPRELTPEELKNIEVLTEKVRLVKLKLAKRNQIVGKLQRQLDDVPNRAEMAQYQRRFLELYNQVAAKHKETKQYFTLYNTLEDKRVYMQKELSLLNSIADNYPEAMQSLSGKEEFLEQFQKIVDGVRSNRLKIENKVLEEKWKRDHVAGSLQNLLELQRACAIAVKQLSLECKNYESLMANEQK